MFVCVMIVLIFSVMTLAACGSSDNDIYYETSGSSLNESSWIKLSGGKWSDDDGESGKYKLDGTKITLLQDGEEIMTGTLKDGVLELEIWGIPAGTYRTKAAQEAYASKQSSSGGSQYDPYSGEDQDSSGNDGNGSGSSQGNTPSGNSGNNSGSSQGDTSGDDPAKEIVTKTLSLYNLDGSITTRQVEVGAPIGALPAPTRSNYRLVGWENLDGDIFDRSSEMPNRDLELYPVWEKTVSAYSDAFLSISPARQGYKNELTFLYGNQYQADKYLYVEITTNDLSGSIDSTNNFSLRNLKGLNYSVASGYTAMWYQGNFNNPNGAQRFSLGYGSNIQLITVSDGSGIVQCTYLLDLYVLSNYTVSLYKTIYDEFPYKEVSVQEEDSLPITVRPTTNGVFEFDRWIYYDYTAYRYKRFTYATEVTSNIRIYQAYKPCIATVELDGGTLEGAVEVDPYMDYVTLPIPTKTDYDFLGWKKADGTYFTNDKGSSQWSYYTSSTGTLTAAWKKKVMYYSFADDVLTILPTDYNAVYRENGSIDSMWYTVVIEDELIRVDENNSAEVGDEFTMNTVMEGRDGYTWVGWFDGETKVSEGTSLTYTFTMPAESKTYTAKWMSCPVTLAKNINKAGTVSGVSGATTVGASTMITATTNAGYTWLGWYDGETKVSEGTSLTYTFTMPALNKTYMAKWEYTQYGITYHLDEGVNDAGNPSTFTINDEITLLPPVKQWYSFEGWYKESSFTNRITAIFVGTTSDVDVYAKWQESSASITYYLDGGVNAAANPKTYTREQVGQTVDLADPSKITEEEITDATSLGNGQYSVTKKVTTYIFQGWYTEASFVNHVTTITLSDDAIVLYAKWNATTSTTTTEQSYLREGNYIYFGEYPQTKVTDSSITNALRSLAGTLPSNGNNQKWTNYGYYASGSVMNYMWYIDLEYSGEKYRGVYFTQYRPYFTTNSSSAGNSYQGDNGYSTSTVYWFKYEPIKWRILEESNGEALILCEMIIDSQEYYNSPNSRTINGQTVYANNYAESNIRAWLNGTFYNTAFTDLQKQLIVLTTVDNSARSTNPNNNATRWNSGNNSHACANTEDYVFLLSEQEVTNSAYGFDSRDGAFDTARQKKNTDYAKSQGVPTSTSSGYVGNGCWWLRSSYYDNRYDAQGVIDRGGADRNYIVYVTGFGVVPALKIKL